MEITSVDDDITNNKDINESGKDEKRRSQREAAKSASMFKSLGVVTFLSTGRSVETSYVFNNQIRNLID